MTRRTNVLVLLASILFGVVTSQFIFDKNDFFKNNKPIIREYSLVGYRTFGEMVNATDAVLKITALSVPKEYVDLGSDGEPDFQGDVGVPIQHIEVHVDKVIRGNNEMENQEITLSQLVFDNKDSVDFSNNQLLVGHKYIIFAKKNRSNPGVGGNLEVWTPVHSGQGIFEIGSDGKFGVRQIGIWPDLFGGNGQFRLTEKDLKLN